MKIKWHLLFALITFVLDSKGQELKFDLSRLKNEGNVTICLFRLQPENGTTKVVQIDSLTVKGGVIVHWAKKYNEPFLGFFSFKNGRKFLGSSEQFIWSKAPLIMTLEEPGEHNLVTFKVSGGENAIYQDPTFMPMPPGKSMPPNFYTRLNFYPNSTINKEQIEYGTTILNTAKQYPSSYCTASKLYNLSLYLTTDILKACYDVLGDYAKNTDAGRAIALNLKNAGNMIQGSKLPKVDVLTAEDKKMSINTIAKEKYYFIDFWASWCVPCRQSFKDLKIVHSKVNSEKIEFMSVSIDAKKDDWVLARSQELLPWSDYLQHAGTAVSIFNLSYIPQNVLVDSKGVMIERNLTIQALNYFLETNMLLK